MSSILTNTSAMAAIQTLRTIGSTLERTQNEVSSGLRIGQASDNAAYWSIATTMRSDSKAISAVEDALGLGAAKVSVAYAGMESTVDILSQFKARLVAASEAGVDKSKIQEELDQFKEQLISISQSSSFSGENWLNTDISDIYDTALNRSSVVSSFVRSSNGSVQVQRTEVDLSSISLFNSTGGGILQVDARSPGTMGGMIKASFDSNGVQALVPLVFSGPLQFDDDTTAISFDITVDADDSQAGTHPGHLVSVTINRSVVDTVYPSLNGLISTTAQFANVIQSQLAGSGAHSTSAGPWVTITSLETSGLNGASIQVTNATSTLVGGSTGGITDAASFAGRAGGLFYWDGPFRVHPSIQITFPLEADGVQQDLIIDRALVNTVLGKTTGLVESLVELKSVLDAAISASGLAIRTLNATNHISMSFDPAISPKNGMKTHIQAWPAFHNLIIDGSDFNIVDVDITAPGASIDYYLTGIEKMLQRATHGASVLGSIDRRIDLQTEFAKTLQNSIGKGIGRLVDADMNEASTRLKALQTQEQLGIQSLSIANSNAEQILTLFH